MKDLLYVGNKLSVHGSTATAIEVLGPLLEREGFKLVYASSKKSKFARLIDMIGKTLSNRNADYVLIDTYSTWNFWYAFAVSQLCRIFSVKYIPILHGGNLPNRLAANPVLCRMIFGHSKVNVAPSRYLAEAFKNAGFATVEIPNPFDPIDFPEKQRLSLSPKLLWVRSFAEIYNPEMAIRTFELVRQKYPEAKLCMVGPDKNGLAEELKSTAQTKNLDIVFTGRLSKHHWAELSKDYDIFINTSRVDNMPFSIIEALSLGMAVVSTNVGGIPHLLEHRKNALLVNDDDARAMAESIDELVGNNSLASAILHNSRAVVAQSYWENVRAKWLEILD